jgi:hypothetical protein
MSATLSACKNSTTAQRILITFRIGQLHKYEEFCRVECAILQPSKHLPAFRINLLPSYSGREYNLFFYAEFGGRNFPTPRNGVNIYQTKWHHLP